MLTAARRMLEVEGLGNVRLALWDALDEGAYGDYTRDLLERLADSAYDRGQLTAEDRDAWKAGLEELAHAGDFYYGMVYHLAAGRRA